MDRQLELLVDEKFNVGLTPNLIPRFGPEDPQAGLNHGFKGMQLCCSAMTAEAMHLSAPASIHSRSTEAHNQDKVSMGTIAARDARSIVDLAQNIAAIHLIASCQALSCAASRRRGDRREPSTGCCARESRSSRPTGAWTARSQAAVDLVASGELGAAVAGSTDADPPQ